LNPKKVIFRNMEEAEAKSGYFSVSSFMITPYLAERIYNYITREKLDTFFQADKNRTCYTTYTFKFKLKQYHDDGKSYISSPGAVGYYKHTLKTQRSVINPGSKSSYVQVLKPKQEDLERVYDLQKRTPTIEKIYFWIAQKYPGDILWMDYSLESPVKPVKYYSSLKEDKPQGPLFPGTSSPYPDTEENEKELPW
jgi:hypothetical protein